MNRTAKISNQTSYRKVYLSDLNKVLNLYKNNFKNTGDEAYSFQIEKLTTQFGLPIAIAECGNELIGYDHHLRTLRAKLYDSCLQFQRAIEDYFPHKTKILQPQGGCMWCGWSSTKKLTPQSCMISPSTRR